MMAYINRASQDNNGVDIFNEIGFKVFFHMNFLPLFRKNNINILVLFQNIFDA